MARYSEERKANILAKLLPPHNMKVADVAAQEGISLPTLYNWRKQASAASAAQPFVAVKLPAQQAADTTCLLKLNGIELKLSALPDTNWLASLSLALERERR